MDDDDWFDFDLDDVGPIGFVGLVLVLVFIVGFFVGSHSMSRRLSDEVSEQARETRVCQEQLHQEQEVHAEWSRSARDDYQRLEKECGIR